MFCVSPRFSVFVQCVPSSVVANEKCAGSGSVSSSVVVTKTVRALVASQVRSSLTKNVRALETLIGKERSGHAAFH